MNHQGTTKNPTSHSNGPKDLNLTQLIYHIYLSSPSRIPPASHPTTPPFPTPAPSAPLRVPRGAPHKKRGGKRKAKNRRPTGAPPGRVPTPPPARQSPLPAGRLKQELRTQHLWPRSTGNGAMGRDAPCRSRSPEKGGRRKSITRMNKKKKKNCDIAIFVVRLIVAVRFPNTKSA